MSPPDPHPADTTKAPSMRWRIALTVAGIVLLALLVHAGTLLLAFEEREEDFIDDILDQQLLHSMAIWQKTPQLAFPNTPDMRLHHLPAGAHPATELPPHLAGLPVGNHEIFVAGREYHVAVREDTSGRFLLEYDVEEHEARLGAQTLIVTLGALLVAGITLFGVYLAAGLINRQLEELADQVDHQGGGSHVRPGMARELLVVAQALDRHAAEQAGQIARERDFSANLSHELRTPLAGIRSDAELIAAHSGTDEAVARRAQRIVATVDRVTALADSLLALARDTLPGTTQPVPLADCVRETWKALAPLRSSGGPLQATPPALVVEIAETTMVRAHPDLLALVMRNLLDNALRHTPSGTIHCLQETSVLTVHDGGPGFAPETLPYVFDRHFHAGAAGRSGIGLALVSHVATASGWQVTADNHPDGGGLVRIDFGMALHPDSPRKSP